MKMKRRVRINVSDDSGSTKRVLEAAEMRLPSRLVRFVFGDYSTVYLLKPGQSIQSVELHEIGPDMAD